MVWCRCMLFPMAVIPGTWQQTPGTEWTKVSWLPGWMRTTSRWKIILILPRQYWKYQKHICLSGITAYLMPKADGLFSCGHIRFTLLNVWKKPLLIEFPVIYGIQPVQGKPWHRTLLPRICSLSQVLTKPSSSLTARIWTSRLPTPSRPMQPMTPLMWKIPIMLAN